MSRRRTIMQSEKKGGGDLPSEYIKLNYVESAGAAYSRASVMADNDVGVRVRFKWSQNKGYAAYLLGVYSTSQRFSPVFLDNHNATGLFCYTPQLSFSAEPYASYDNSLHLVEFNIDNRKIKWDGVVVNSVGTISQKEGVLIGIFCRINDGSDAEHIASAKIYELQFFKNDILISNLVPAQRQADGAIGFYDTTRHEFIISESSTAFSGG